MENTQGQNQLVDKVTPYQGQIDLDKSKKLPNIQQIQIKNLDQQNRNDCSDTQSYSMNVYQKNKPNHSQIKKIQRTISKSIEIFKNEVLSDDNSSRKNYDYYGNNTKVKPPKEKSTVYDRLSNLGLPSSKISSGFSKRSLKILRKNHDGSTRHNMMSSVLSSKQDTSRIFRTKRSYVQVDHDKREQLIKIVQSEGLTIKKASQVLKINYSTAKHIVKQYRLMSFGNMANLNTFAMNNLMNINASEQKPIQIMSDLINQEVVRRISQLSKQSQPEEQGMDTLPKYCHQTRRPITANRLNPQLTPDNLQNGNMPQFQKIITTTPQVGDKRLHGQIGGDHKMKQMQLPIHQNKMTAQPPQYDKQGFLKPTLRCSNISGTAMAHQQQQPKVIVLGSPPSVIKKQQQLGRPQIINKIPLDLKISPATLIQPSNPQVQPPKQNEIRVLKSNDQITQVIMRPESKFQTNPIQPNQIFQIQKATTSKHNTVKTDQYDYKQMQENIKQLNKKITDQNNKEDQSAVESKGQSQPPQSQIFAQSQQKSIQPPKTEQSSMPMIRLPYLQNFNQQSGGNKQFDGTHGPTSTMDNIKQNEDMLNNPNYDDSSQNLSECSSVDEQERGRSPDMKHTTKQLFIPLLQEQPKIQQQPAAGENQPKTIKQPTTEVNQEIVALNKSINASKNKETIQQKTVGIFKQQQKEIYKELKTQQEKKAQNQKKDDPSPLFKELINHETKKLENNFSFKKEQTSQHQSVPNLSLQNLSNNLTGLHQSGMFKSQSSVMNLNCLSSSDIGHFNNNKLIQSIFLVFKHQFLNANEKELDNLNHLNIEELQQLIDSLQKMQEEAQNLYLDKLQEKIQVLNKSMCKTEKFRIVGGKDKLYHIEKFSGQQQQPQTIAIQTQKLSVNSGVDQNSTTIPQIQMINEMPQNQLTNLSLQQQSVGPVARIEVATNGNQQMRVSDILVAQQNLSMRNQSNISKNIYTAQQLSNNLNQLNNVPQNQAQQIRLATQMNFQNQRNLSMQVNGGQQLPSAQQIILNSNQMVQAKQSLNFSYLQSVDNKETLISMPSNTGQPFQQLTLPSQQIQYR